MITAIRPQSRVGRWLSLCALVLILSGVLPLHHGAAAAPAPAVTTPTGAVSLTAGEHYALAVTPDGNLWAWGAFNTVNDYQTTYPELDGEITGVVAAARAQPQPFRPNPKTIAAKSDGTVWSADRSLTWTQVSGLSDIKAVAAGQEHYVALKSDGTVWTWGVGWEGQLGDGTTPHDRAAPGQVTGLTGVVSIAAGGSHTLALKADGTLWGWGSNWAGQLGDGTKENRATPVQTTGLTGVVEVTTDGQGGDHTLARTSDGQVWAWGHNSAGQLGLGADTTSLYLTPRAVPGMNDAISISTTDWKSFAVRRDGSVWRWGRPDGKGMSDLTPVAMTGIPPVLSVVAGTTAAYAQTAEGEVWSWGTNEQGELGQAIDRTFAGTVYPPGRVLPLAVDTANPTWPAGASLRAEQVTGTDAVLTWDAAQDDMRISGYAGSCKDLFGPHYLLIDAKEPTRGRVDRLVPSSTYECSVKARDLAGHESEPLTMTLSTTADLAPPQWNGGGGLGAYKLQESSLTLVWSGASDPGGLREYRVYQDGVELALVDSRFTSLAVTGLVPGTDYTFKVEARDSAGNWSQDGPTLVAQTGVTNPDVQISASWGYMTTVGPDGSVLWWGETPPLPGDTWRAYTPQPVPGVAGVTAVAASGGGVAVQRPDGTVWWVVKGKPAVHLSSVDGAVALSGSWVGHVLALMPDGSVWAWGSGEAGQLGDGAQQNRAEPVPVPGLTNVKAVAAAAYTSVALRDDGTVWQWGYLMGTDGNTVPRALAPVQVQGLSDITAIAAFDTFGLALDKDGRVRAWGVNDRGQLGDGTQTNRPAAVPVRDLTDVTAIAAGESHSLAIKADGSVWTWGLMPANSSLPRQVSGLTGARSAGAGYMYSVVVNANGDIWSWGNNGAAMLGRGREPADAMVPGRVALPWTDPEPPVWPSGAALAVTKVLATRLTLSWPAAQDNRGVTAYRVLRNGTLLKTLAADQTTYGMTDLRPTTSYTFQVQAGDAAGNWSDGPSVALTTPAVDSTPPALARDRSGNPELVLMTKRGDQPWVTVNPTSVTASGISFTADTADRYALAGLITEPPESMLLNGKSVLFGMDGLTFAVLFRPTGSATDTLQLEATDPSGNKGLLATVIVTYNSGPSVTISEPAGANLLVKSSAVTIKGSTSRPFVGLAAVDADQPNRQFAVAYTFVGSQFTAVVRVPEEPGTYRVRLVAFDSNGNRSLPDKNGKDLRAITFDPVPPAPVQLTSPVFTGGVAYTNQSSVQLAGKAEPLGLVTLTAGSKSYTVTASPVGDWTINNIALGGGENQLTVTVTDRAGNRSEPVVVKLIADRSSPDLKSALLRKADGSEAGPVSRKGSQLSAAVNGTGSYTLELTFTEPLSTARVADSKIAQVTQDGAVVRLTVGGLKQGANSVTIDVKDQAGNSSRFTAGISLDSQGPQVSLAGKVRSWLVGALTSGDRQPVTITGSANEPLSTVRLAPVGGSDLSELALTATVDQRDPKKWSATLSVPAGKPASWQFAFVGVDLAGNVSSAPTPAVTVTADPSRPVLSMATDLSGIIYTRSRKLTVKGTVTDGESGVKQAVIGTKQMADSRHGQSFAFQSDVALAEGRLTTVKLYGEDMAGNLSDLLTLRAVMKNSLSLSKVGATFNASAKTLNVRGQTDAALKIDEQWVVAVPVSIEVTLGKSQIFQTTLAPGSDRYNPATGEFGLLIQAETWAKGTYTVTVKALPPVEFPDLQPVTKTLTFTIR